MAEETKEPQESCGEKAKKVFWTALKVILGLAFIVLGALAVWTWKTDLFTVFKGCIGLFLVLSGIISLAIAKE
jgi:hypothetical protein